MSNFSKEFLKETIHGPCRKHINIMPTTCFFFMYELSMKIGKQTIDLQQIAW